jgi:glycine/D-amino acid oxidase-like deaminating enzyme
MRPNFSPWIHQLERTREPLALTDNTSADIAIVGGGIAGLMTSYFTLRDTDKKVVLLEADKVAHGATGHNAGQITSYFERPFSDIVEEFGLSLASDGQRNVESAWTLLDEIVRDAQLTTPVHRFTGHAGCTTLSQLLVHLENNRLRREGGLPVETIMVAEEWSERSEIPEQYRDLYSTASQAVLLSQLCTENPIYIATLSYQKGCTNSARLTEELASYLLQAYPDHFDLFEEARMNTLQLHESSATITCGTISVEAERVVLCTNGFEHFTIQNEAGEDIDVSFHHLMTGRIGYMSGYVEDMNMEPTAISYFLPSDSPSVDPTGESYYYLTRRPHHTEEGVKNLICMGGPDTPLPNLAVYSRETACREDMHMSIDDFLTNNYQHYPSSDLEYKFCWHGLMGYTPNGIRRVGVEPKNPVLLYNLGCNGVGILPSIYGGNRIAALLKGEVLEPSIFDPK